MNDQHLEDIEIPDIEIAAGWPVSGIESIEDCDDAYAYLMAAVAEIEHELELKDLGVCKFADPTWPARARRALKYKRAALQLVGYKRGYIMEARRREAAAVRDRAFIDHIKASVSVELFSRWCAEFTAEKEAA